MSKNAHIAYALVIIVLSGLILWLVYEKTTQKTPEVSQLPSSDIALELTGTIEAVHNDGLTVQLESGSERIYIHGGTVIDTANGLPLALDDLNKGDTVFLSGPIQGWLQADKPLAQAIRRQ